MYTRFSSTHQRSPIRRGIVPNWAITGSDNRFASAYATMNPAAVASNVKPVNRSDRNRLVRAGAYTISNGCKTDGL